MALYFFGRNDRFAAMLGFIQNLGAMEIFLILLIVLLLFGAKRLPELSRSMGRSLREFKKATSEVEDDFRDAMNEEPETRKSSKKIDRTAEESAKSGKEAESVEPVEAKKSD